MANIRVTGSGLASAGYTFELDGVARDDILKAVLTWDPNDLVKAEITFYVRDLVVENALDGEVVTVLSERRHKPNGVKS